jgi:cation diffusion facilitator CzcD-associated flavoprotein CzcO
VVWDDRRRVYRPDIPLKTWDSPAIGSTRTASGLLSDTIVKRHSRLPPLVEYARERLPQEMYVDDHLPITLLQKYYRDVIEANALNVRSGIAIASVERRSGGFLATLESGEQITTRRFVDATGIGWNKNFPDWVRKIDDQDRVHHSADRRPLPNLQGKHLLLIGGGQATPDIATYHYERGTQVTLAMRATGFAQSHLAYPPEFLSPQFIDRYRSQTPAEKLSTLAHIKSQGPWVTPRSYTEFVKAMESRDGFRVARR